MVHNEAKIVASNLNIERIISMHNSESKHKRKNRHESNLLDTNNMNIIHQKIPISENFVSYFSR